MTTDGFLIFQSILRERKISLQHLRIVYVFCEYTRRQAIPGFSGHPQGLRQQLTQKASQGVGRERGGWGGGGLGRQEKGPSPFSLSSFFSKRLPFPAPFPICDCHEGYQPLSLNTRWGFLCLVQKYQCFSSCWLEKGKQCTNPNKTFNIQCHNELILILGTTK